ncbi:relaxase/mobilization nuclease domain-containing protein [Lentilitoribacter sp. EG35]|uniref:relaxase/mobilization nuclease domain-containing protein n=1 Tax=Lentilitoribacter sp. EG35 TaxID=3234192 RepID=UPI003460077D
MSDQVRELIANAIGTRENVRPVDIVMGDHWGEIDLSNSMRLSLLYSVLKKNDAGGFAKGGGGGNTSRLRSPFSVAKRSPQAMVKVVKKGGTSSARAMRDQMSYLSKDGDAKLERSERYFGIELDDKTHEDLIRSWGLSGETKTQSDKTTHFVVSFPNDTDHNAAYKAGRAWADEMFASGNYGDVYDYYTAFHTDRAHPHMHVVVNRRGMEHGDWLKVSLRSQFNYDEFRAVQVEVAAREGIYLEASHRLARGLTDRPVLDAEYRDAVRDGRKPVAPSHIPETALKAAASVILHVHQMGAAAAQLQDKYPELSEIMSITADTILAGHEVMPGNQQNNRPLNFNEINQASEFIMSRRLELLDGLKEIDDEIKSLPDGEAKSRFERDVSQMKADTAELMPDVAELQRHTFENLNGFYQGLKVEDDIEKDAKLIADREVAELAKEAGIEPDKFVNRFETGEPASQELADTWRQDELEDI